MKRWGEKRYHSLDYHLKHTYGEKLYKLALNGGMTCPNRDGTLGKRPMQSLILPIFRHTQILMPKSVIWRRFLQRQSPVLKSRFSPLPPDQTV